MVKQLVFFMPVVLAYCAVGAVALAIGVSHIREHAWETPEYLRMVIDIELRKLDMMLAMVGIVIFWPVAVAYAVKQNIDQQRQPHARYSMR